MSSSPAGSSSTEWNLVVQATWDLYVCLYLRNGLEIPEIIGLATMRKPDAVIETHEFARWLDKHVGRTACCFFDSRSGYVELHGSHSRTDMTPSSTHWYMNFNYGGQKALEEHPTSTVVEGSVYGVMRGRDTGKRDICMVLDKFWDNKTEQEIEDIMRQAFRKYEILNIPVYLRRLEEDGEEEPLPFLPPHPTMS